MSDTSKFINLLFIGYFSYFLNISRSITYDNSTKIFNHLNFLNVGPFTVFWHVEDDTSSLWFLPVKIIEGCSI